MKLVSQQFVQQLLLCLGVILSPFQSAFGLSGCACQKPEQTSNMVAEDGGCGHSKPNACPKETTANITKAGPKTGSLTACSCGSSRSLRTSSPHGSSSCCGSKQQPAADSSVASAKSDSGSCCQKKNHINRPENRLENKPENQQATSASSTACTCGESCSCTVQKEKPAVPFTPLSASVSVEHILSGLLLNKTATCLVALFPPAQLSSASLRVPNSYAILSQCVSVSRFLI